MPDPEPSATPAEGLGLFSQDPDLLSASVVRAWELFADVLESVDMDAPTRSRRHSARELVLPLGTWPDNQVLTRMRADARSGNTETEPLDEQDDRLVAAHGDASREQILATVSESVEHVRGWLSGAGSLEAEGHLPVPSPLGILPLATAVHSGVFRLAITARDLAPAGAPESDELTALGLVALWDAAGAVAARIELEAGVTAHTDSVTVAITSASGRWQTVVGQPATDSDPTVMGPAQVLVDMAGGRLSATALGRHIRLRHTRQVLAMTPVLDELPDLPGGPVLRRAARVARFVSRAG